MDQLRIRDKVLQRTRRQQRSTTAGVVLAALVVAGIVAVIVYFSVRDNTPDDDPACSNKGGTKVDGVCLCYDGFAGTACAEDIGQCGDCNDHGTCVVVQDQGGEDTRCVCDEGWSGPQCETNDCGNAGPCVNGVCQNGICQCHSGFSGANCAEADRCCVGPDGGGCGGNGTCNPVTGECLCTNGFSGPRCEFARDNPCNGVDCGGSNGTCIVLKDGSAQCECGQGALGPSCEENVTTCLVADAPGVTWCFPGGRFGQVTGGRGVVNPAEECAEPNDLYDEDPDQNRLCHAVQCPAGQRFDAARHVCVALSQLALQGEDAATLVVDNRTSLELLVFVLEDDNDSQGSDVLDDNVDPQPEEELDAQLRNATPTGRVLPFSSRAFSSSLAEALGAVRPGKGKVASVVLRPAFQDSEISATVAAVRGPSLNSPAVYSWLDIEPAPKPTPWTDFTGRTFLTSVGFYANGSVLRMTARALELPNATVVSA